MIFKVDKKFFEKVPNAIFGVVVTENFNNKKEYEFINKMLNDSVSNSFSKYKDENIKEHANILPYREAFRKLDINPNKYMCSIEALISRIAKGNKIPNINPLVDLGNALSIKYSLPLGAHDIDKFTNNTIEIRGAKETDEFIPFGSNEVEHPDIEEVIYVSGNDVKTRRWTWRQGENSKITQNTTNVFFPIDGFSDVNKNDVLALQNELVNILTNDLGLDAKTAFIDINCNEIEL